MRSPTTPLRRTEGWSIRLTPLLLILTIGMILTTLTSLGVFCYQNGRNIIHHFIERDLIQASQSATLRIRQHLDSTEDLIAEWEQLCHNQIVTFQDPERMTRYMAEQIRNAEHIRWLSHVDHPGGSFMGVRRDESNTIILNKSAPELNKGIPQEWVLPMRGKPRPVPQTSLEPYDPRDKEWYRGAIRQPDFFWTEPYPFHEGPMGITVSKAHRHPDTGEILGVYTADFLLSDLESFLSEIYVSPHGATFLINSTGMVLARPTAHSENYDEAFMQAAIRSFEIHLPEMGNDDDPLWSSFDWKGETYESAIDAFAVPGDKKWLTLIILPRSDTIGYVYDQLQGMTLIGMGVILVAILIGSLIARRVAAPIQRISDDLVEVGKFNITTKSMPATRIHELSMVGDTVTRMKNSLRSFGRYVPVELVHRLMESGQEAVLGGEIRPVTILFTDLAGFTQFSENQPPEKVVPHLAIHLQAITDAVNAHHGSVDKYLGDGVLALFNAPQTDSDHVVHACEAALDALHRLPPHHRGDQQPYSRIGLHTGEALVGNIGTPDRFDFTAIGDTVNLASRMEGMNKLYGTRILATQNVRDQSGDTFHWRQLDLVAVKGRSSQTSVHELIGLQAGISEEIREATHLYEKALSSYLNRQFDTALKQFEKARELRPEDEAAVLFIERCQNFSQHPPPMNWKGVFVATSK